MSIAKDFKKMVDKGYMDDRAEAHLDAWADRYSEKSKKDVEFDLRVNHDNDSEVERIETDLGRKVNDDERAYYIEQFIKAVVRNHRRKA